MQNYKQGNRYSPTARYNEKLGVNCMKSGKSKSDRPTIPISSGLSRFCFKIPNPDQYAIGIGKIPISTLVVIFSSNSHKRKKNAEYLTLMSRKTEETVRNIK